MVGSVNMSKIMASAFKRKTEQGPTEMTIVMSNGNTTTKKFTAEDLDSFLMTVASVRALTVPGPSTYYNHDAEPVPKMEQL